MTSLPPVPGPRSLVPERSAPDTLRVLMLAPTPYFADRGCHVRIYEEARTLVELGHDVRIVTYHIGRDMDPIPTVRIPVIPWYRKLSAGPSWHKPYLDVLLFFAALRTARSFRPHLVHAHLHEGGLVGLLLKKILGIPLLFDCQGSLTAESMDHGFFSKGSLLYRLFSRVEGFINRNADFIVTSSGPGADALVNEWGVPREKVAALIDGVNCRDFRPHDRMEARRQLGVPPGKVVAVFLGILNRYQGLDLLLDAVAAIRKSDDTIHFVIMGFPEETYRQKATAMGIADGITFTGKVDYSRAPLYLSAGDLALSPKISLTEANGKLFNYMACGLPTVVFDTPINREILGETGTYARFGDAGVFAEKIRLLARDEALRRQLSEATLAKVRRDHSWESRGERLLGIYGRLSIPSLKL